MSPFAKLVTLSIPSLVTLMLQHKSWMKCQETSTNEQLYSHMAKSHGAILSNIAFTKSCNTLCSLETSCPSTTYRYSQAGYTYNWSGSIQMGWIHTNGVDPYKWGGSIQMGWIHTIGVDPYKWGGSIQRGWIHTNGVDPYNWSGSIQMGWIHTKGVDPYKWSG